MQPRCSSAEVPFLGDSHEVSKVVEKIHIEFDLK